MKVNWEARRKRWDAFKRQKAALAEAGGFASKEAAEQAARERGLVKFSVQWLSGNWMGSAPGWFILL